MASYSFTTRVMASAMTRRMAAKAFVASSVNRIGGSVVQQHRSLQTKTVTSNSKPPLPHFSYASPESDFCGSLSSSTLQAHYRRHQATSTFPLSTGTTNVEGGEWSHTLSFASPESDFTLRGNVAKDQEEEEWSHTLSFGSPESDFVGAQQEVGKKPEWSNKLSFASPEEDFTYQAERVPQQEGEWSQTMSFASPESDFVSSLLSQENVVTKEDFIDHVEKKSHYRDSMAYALAHAAPESDFTSPHVQQLLNERQKEQLAHVDQQYQQQLSSSSNMKKDMMVQKADIPLPSTLQEAEAETDRAVVITKATHPFNIVDVNDAWVGLCGYTKEESRHRTLGDLLQGDETDTDALHAMVGQLLHGQESRPTVVTNYTKTGRKFTNRIRAGQLKDAKGEITHFVGVLQEVKEELDHFEGKMKKNQKM